MAEDGEAGGAQPSNKGDNLDQPAPPGGGVSASLPSGAGTGRTAADPDGDKPGSNEQLGAVQPAGTGAVEPDEVGPYVPDADEADAAVAAASHASPAEAGNVAGLAGGNNVAAGSAQQPSAEVEGSRDLANASQMARVLTTEAPRPVPSGDPERNAPPATEEPEDTQDQLPDRQPAPPPSASTSEPASLAPRAGSLLTGVLAVNLPRVNASVERFFARMEDLGKEWADSHLAVELAPWLGTIAAALAAAEWVRLQRSKQQALVGNVGGGDSELASMTWTFLVSEDEP
jgi:hypothetical protein